MFKYAETFRQVATGLQSLAVVVALIIGGVWTFFVFRAQLSISRARASLDKLNRELERSSAIGIQISAQQLCIPEDKDRYVLATVTITNRGNRNTRLVWDRQPLSAAKVRLHEHSDALLKEVSRTAIYFLSESGKRLVERSAGFRVGDERRYEAVLPVESPGLYLVTFLAKVDNEHLTDPERAIGRIDWKAMCHVVVA